MRWVIWDKVSTSFSAASRVTQGTLCRSWTFLKSVSCCTPMCKEGINKDETDACIDIDKEDI